MLFRWLQAHRRRAVVQRPFPPAWRDVLRRCVRQVEWLSDAEHGRLLEWIAVFLDEKRFEGCRGMEVTDEVRLAIAGQAGIAALGLPGEHFAGLKSVLVYPGDYVVPRSTPLGGGAELQWREARVGETWSGGSMALSWSGVLAGGRLRDGPRSVVIHECAHLLDLEDGEIDGVPPLAGRGRRREWAARAQECRARFEDALDEGRVTAFDDYAAESAAEFFAVASECFFQDPHRLARHDSTLYELLGEAWNQDPRGRVPPRPARSR